MTKEEDKFGEWVISKLDKLFDESIKQGKELGFTEDNARYITIAVVRRCLSPQIKDY